MLDTFTKLVNGISDLLGGAVSTGLMTLAFVAFLLAVINFIWKRRQGDDKGLEQAKNMLWWSVFGLFVMVAVWGIVNFLAVNLLGNDANKKDVVRPQTNFGPGGSGTGSNNTSGTGVNTGPFNSGGQLQGCYQYNNAQCASHAECKVDSIDGCVPR